MTMADLAVYVVMSEVQLRVPNLVKDAPLLAASMKRVEENPKIAKYIAGRPKTPW